METRIEELTKDHGSPLIFKELSFGFGYKKDCVFKIDCSPADGVNLEITNGVVKTSPSHVVFFSEYISVYSIDQMIAALLEARDFYTKIKRDKNEDKSSNNRV